MNDKTKEWILLSIFHESRGSGLNILDLFRNRPEFVTNNMPEYLVIVNNLEKENLIEKDKHSYAPIYKLTTEGTKSLKKALQKTGHIEYMSLMRSVPFADLRYRIKTIEAFLTYIILLFALTLIINWLGKINYHETITLAILFLLFFTSFIMVLVTGVLILINYIDIVIRSISNRLAENIDKNKDTISSILIIITIVVGVYLFVKFTDYGIEDIIYYVIGGIILLIITKFSIIRDYLTRFINKIFKKSIQ